MPDHTKHRYIGMSVDFAQSANLCQHMEDQGIEIFAVNAFVQPLSPTQIAMLCFVMGRVLRDAPKTKLEIDNEAEATRLVQPVNGRISTNGGKHGH